MVRALPGSASGTPSTALALALAVALPLGLPALDERLREPAAQDRPRSPAGGPTPTASSPAKRTGALTRSSTAAAATRINLRPTDLRGFAVLSLDEPTRADEEDAEGELLRCAGGAPGGTIFDVGSEELSRGQFLPSLQVSSEVAFRRDPRAVVRDVRALASGRAAPCLASFFRRAVTAGGTGTRAVSFGRIDVLPLRPRVTGVAGAYGYRVTATATVAGQRIPFTVDVLGAGLRRTEVTLLVYGVGTAMRPADRDALFGKLVARTRTAAL